MPKDCDSISPSDRRSASVGEVARPGLMGGRDKVVSAAKEALAKNEYAWAVELINYIYKLDPNDVEARQIKAAALRKLGQLSFGSIGRPFFLSEARALEGKEQIPRNIPPQPEVIAASPATFVNYLGTIRNRLGDSHGQGGKPVHPRPRHAQLVVNLAGSMATFLIATWLEQDPASTAESTNAEGLRLHKPFRP